MADICHSTYNPMGGVSEQVLKCTLRGKCQRIEEKRVENHLFKILINSLKSGWLLTCFDWKTVLPENLMDFTDELDDGSLMGF